MSDIVYCNKEQSEKILRTYFLISPVVTKISKNSYNGCYYITALTIPGLYETEWQYRPWNNNITNKKIKACFGSLEKGNRTYKIPQPYCDYPDELMSSINKSFERAIDRYERGCDIFHSEGMQIGKGLLQNIIYNLTKSIKRGYIWIIIILSILLLLSLTSCAVDDSIQNYVGSEIIYIENFKDINNRPYQQITIRTKDIGTKNNTYHIVTVKCLDAQGYQIGDTIKLRKFPK